MFNPKGLRYDKNIHVHVVAQACLYVGGNFKIHIYAWTDGKPLKGQSQQKSSAFLVC